ncbi:ABC transporter substrate-binding protein [Microbacterium lacus]|uniref:Extracellular solute-binding protein n=1 Tax=Microbacterium lacus TaxID=415217 RepID=A0ABN2FX89_9MICO
MVNRVRRLSLATVALTSAALVIAGCSSTPDGGAAAEDKVITWTNYQGGDANAKYKEVIAAFEKANPGWTVEQQNLAGDGTYSKIVTSQIQANKAPDLVDVMVADIPAMVDAGMLTDLSDESWAARQLPAVESYAESTTGGSTYALVTGLDVIGVYYNKDLFNDAGVEVPTDWPSFETAVKTFRSDGITPLALGGKDGWPINVQMQLMAANLLAGTAEPDELTSGETPYVDSVAWNEVLDDAIGLVADQAYDPNVLGIDWPTSAADFAAGKSAMLIMGSFGLPAIRQANEEMNLGMFALPYGDSGSPRAAVGYGTFIAVPTNATQSEGAKKFLDFLTSDEEYPSFLKAAAQFPSLEGAPFEAFDESATEIAKTVQSDSFEYNSSGGLNNAAVQAIASQQFQSLFNGTGSPRSVLEAFDTAIAQAK